MTFDNRFAVWRRAADGITPQRTMGGPTVVRRGDVTITGPGRTTWQTPVVRWARVDYFDTPLDLDSFVAADEECGLDVTCPCGEPLAAATAGELLREIYKHCGAAGHPRPKFER